DLEAGNATKLVARCLERVVKSFQELGGNMAGVDDKLGFVHVMSQDVKLDVFEPWTRQGRLRRRRGGPLRVPPRRRWRGVVEVALGHGEEDGNKLHVVVGIRRYEKSGSRLLESEDRCVPAPPGARGNAEESSPNHGQLV